MAYQATYLYPGTGRGGTPITVYYDNVAVDSAAPTALVRWRTTDAADPTFVHAPAPAGTYVEYWIADVVTVVG